MVVPDGVEGLRKVKGDQVNLMIGAEKVRYVMGKRYYSGCSRASGPECKLVFKLLIECWIS